MAFLKNFNLGSLISDTGKGAAELINRAAKDVSKVAEDVGKAAESTGKGAAELINRAAKDVSKVAEDVGKAAESAGKGATELFGSIGNGVTDAIGSAKANLEGRALEAEMRQLQPIFETDLGELLDSEKLICIAQMDQRHAESALCRYSVGCISRYGDQKVLQLYPDKAQALGLTFFPGMEIGEYYKDPYVPNRYIMCDMYFSELKLKMLHEMEMVAQKLGAKHFHGRYEDKQSVTQKTSKENSAFAKNLSAGHVHKTNESQDDSMEYESDLEFEPQIPEEPILCYLRYDNNVKSLIDQRIHTIHPVKHAIVMVDLCKNIGVGGCDAWKAEAKLKAMKAAGKRDFTRALKIESRYQYKFEIEF